MHLLVLWSWGRTVSCGGFSVVDDCGVGFKISGVRVLSLLRGAAVANIENRYQASHTWSSSRSSLVYIPVSVAVHGCQAVAHNCVFCGTHLFWKQRCKINTKTLLHGLSKQDKMMKWYHSTPFYDTDIHQNSLHQVKGISRNHMQPRAQCWNRVYCARRYCHIMICSYSTWLQMWTTLT